MPQLDLQLPVQRRETAARKDFGLAPLHPLTPRQRIGYLDTAPQIECVKAMPGFRAGVSYRVATSTVKAMRWTEKTNLDGQTEQIELNGQEMAVFLRNDLEQPICFMNERFMSREFFVGEGVAINHGFDVLIEHFRLPEIPDVASLYPENYFKHLGRIDELEKFIRLSNPSFAFKMWQRDDLARTALRNGFILGWDTGLGKGLASFIWPSLKTGWDFTEHGFTPQDPILIVAIGDLHRQFEDEGWDKLGVRVLRLNRKTNSIRNAFYLTSFTELTGQCRVMELARKFKCIVVDEATKIKGEDSDIGTRVRSLNPDFRAVVTATPIKNRLPDLFSLIWWAAGGQPQAHPGFPYKDTPQDREWFTETFMVMERNLTKEKKFGSSRKFIKPTAQACNLPRLWRITAPMILRRRKTDVGELVAKVPHRIFVPMGKEQARAYRKIINNVYLDKNGRPATGAKLQDLRQCAACPDSPKLEAFRSKFEYTPKIAAALSLIDTILRRAEQAIVFSAFNEATDCISRRLCAAGIAHVLCDGRFDYDERASAASRFKRGKPRIMLAGEGSMAYGHSFSRCNNIISINKDWAYDLWEQATNRGHRLDSIKDLNLYSILTKGSIDEGIENLLDEKSASAQLVLDGEVVDTEISEADLLKLLQTAVHDFDNNQDAPVDERQLLEEWPTLKQRLGEAQNFFNQS